MKVIILLTLAQIGRQIGYVFKPDKQLFYETVEEEIAFGVRNLGLPRAGDTKIREVMDYFELSVTRKLTPEHSAGEKDVWPSAVTLGGFLLDEPTTGLDPTASNCWAITDKRSPPKGVVVISHDQKFMDNTLPSYSRRRWAVHRRIGDIQHDVNTGPR